MEQSASKTIIVTLLWGIASPAAAEIVGGDPVPVCGFPTVVDVDRGCTGTLVHPRVISTAQHCGKPTAVGFGQTRAGAPHSVRVGRCVGTGSSDSQLCELMREVTEIPVTPVLFGCEVDRYLKVDQPVVIAGFGNTSNLSGGGTKRWANQRITTVEAKRIIVGDAGVPPSPCRGDSGGPVFTRVEDGTWRVLGTLTGGTTGIPCNSAADFKRIDAVVANFEQDTGIDITPCFDAQSGQWSPTKDCGGFFAGSDKGMGTWSNWCQNTARGGPSSICGAPFGGPGVAGQGGAGTQGGAGIGGMGAAGYDGTPGVAGLGGGNTTGAAGMAGTGTLAGMGAPAGTSAAAGSPVPAAMAGTMGTMPGATGGGIPAPAPQLPPTAGPRPAATAPDGGCSCSLAARASSAPGAWSLAVALAFLATRSRRRRTRVAARGQGTMTE